MLFPVLGPSLLLPGHHNVCIIVPHRLETTELGNLVVKSLKPKKSFSLSNDFLKYAVTAMRSSVKQCITLFLTFMCLTRADQSTVGQEFEDETMEEQYLLVCSLVPVQLTSTCLGMMLPTVGWARSINHQLR